MRMTKEGRKRDHLVNWIGQVTVQFEVTRGATELRKGRPTFG